MTDWVLDWMKRHNIEVTRETYLALSYGDLEPGPEDEPLPAEILLGELSEWDRARVRRFLRAHPDAAVSEAIEETVRFPDVAGEFRMSGTLLPGG